MKNFPGHLLHRRRAFSLMEVLLAVFILGIGLIMVATVFPVGADWTRQSTEDTKIGSYLRFGDGRGSVCKQNRTH